MTAFFKRKPVIITVVIILLAIFTYFILPISIPLILALLTALLLEPTIQMLRSKFNIKRNISVMITFITFLLFISVVTFFITTKVVGETVEFMDDVPVYVYELTIVWNDIEKAFSNTAQDLPEEVVDSITEEMSNFVNNSVRTISSSVNIDNAKAIFTNIPNYLVNLLVYLIALFLVMLDLPRIKLKFYSFFTETTTEKVNFLFKRIKNVVFGFIKAQFLVSLVIFLASFIGLLFITPEIALVMSLLIWIIDLIPLIGSIIVLGPWTIFAFILGDAVMGTKLAILAAVLLIIRRTLEPKVMGSNIGLSPLSTLISMFLGLKLFGFLGFFIGPFILIIYNSSREAGIIKFNFKI
ncbi:sporulation integral membrane protein YtvI [Bacillus carboniphilus]|uniref:Sporulation integral membrane protein YtvI n=1 Tax=Bacillus carboniphilus TaxID=86663 RepID=A0ABY9JYY3_9BACI|nr:sporulation integral membrane protein YtvI [Bacillus carboniphilus]WLR43650.1 sporulation integral membrane protein YtvI [Bacillus carboniphilus]